MLAGRPVVLWFWAAWCTRCRAAAPEVAAVGAEFEGRVSVVGVAGLGSGIEAMRRFVAETGLTGLVHVADDDGAVWRRFGVTAQEYFVMLDGSGAIVARPVAGERLGPRVAALAG